MPASLGGILIGGLAWEGLKKLAEYKGIKIVALGTASVLSTTTLGVLAATVALGGAGYAVYKAVSEAKKDKGLDDDEKKALAEINKAEGTKVEVVPDKKMVAAAENA